MTPGAKTCLLLEYFFIILQAAQQARAADRARGGGFDADVGSVGAAPDASSLG